MSTAELLRFNVINYSTFLFYFDVNLSGLMLKFCLFRFLLVLIGGSIFYLGEALFDTL
jgi:hypothetical protein